MRRLIICLLGVLALSSTIGGAATEIGIRGGWAHARGDLFEGSGDPGSSGLYGALISIGLFSSIDLEFAYERYRKEFEFDRATYRETFFGGDAEYEDQAYLFTGKLNLPVGTGPLGLYGGGGASLHEIDVLVDAIENSSGLDDYLDEIQEDRSEWEWHVVGGLGLRLPGLPLRAYGEYRYQNIDGTSPSFSSIYGGLNLYLE